MLAEPKRQSVEYEMKEISSPSSTLTLFEGLNFPEVPTTRIAPRNTEPASASPVPGTTKVAPPAAREKEVEEEDEGQTAESSETTSLLHATSHSPIAPAVAEPVERISNLSVLYTPIEVVSATADMYSYPELPNIQRREGIAPMSMQRATPPSLAPTATATAAAATHTVQVFVQPSPASAMQTTAPTDTNSLVHELLAENSRLSEEVNLLRRQLAVAHQNPSPQQQQVQLQQQTVTGVGVSDPRSSPTSSDAKYVCCGHCRQWLRAPKEAVYVRCSHCDAVNNCRLAPTSSPNNANMESMALQQPPPNTQSFPFQMMDCLTRAFY